MKITTPTATLGIRGTTGLVEVPEGAAANNPNNVAIKLYPDADGRVGRIEVNDRAGARLGFLTQGASGFTIRPGSGGARFAAVPLVIPQAVMLRDQGFVRQLHSTQNVGRQLVFQQREFRRANPGFVNPNRPIRQLAARPAAGQMVRPDRARPGQQQPVSWIVPAARGRTGCPQQPVSRHCQARRTARGSSSRPLNRPNRSNRARRHAPAGRSSPARPIKPGLPPRADSRSSPVAATARSAAARRTTATVRLPPQPACRRARDNRNSPAAHGTPRHGRDCRTGSAFRDCSAPPGCSGCACRCSVRDCPPRRGGLRPRRNAASRREGAALVGQMESGYRAAASRAASASKLRGCCRVRHLHRVDGHRLYLQRK